MGVQLDTYEKTPDVYITEAASPPPPPSGIPVSTGLMFGVTKWGPINEPTLVQSFAQWVRIFGDYISSTYPAYKQVKKYFQNGGRRLYFIRVVHMTDVTDPDTVTAVKAFGWIYDDAVTPAVVAAAVAGGSNAGDDTGVSSGTYTGNTGSFRVTVTTAGAYGGVGTVTIYFTPDGGSEATVGTATPSDGVAFELDNGAYLALTDGGDTNLTLNDEWTIAVTEAGYTVTDQRIKITALYAGSLGNSLTVKVGVSSGGIAGEFKLEVYLDGVLAEGGFDNLSVDADADNYFIKKVNGESLYIVLEDTTNVNDVGTSQPDVALTAGVDGLTGLVSTDYVGDGTGQTGMKSASVIPLEEPCILGCPDADVMADPSVIQKAMADFCDEVMTTSFSILAVPDDKNSTEAKTYQLTTLAKDSPRAAIYYPFVMDEDDSEYISPVGFIMGIYARFAFDINKGIWWSPAGSDAILKGAKAVKVTLNATNAGILNENRVNIIKNLVSKGIVIWGARTLAITKAADFRYIGARLNTSDVEARIYKNTKWAPLRPHDTELYGDIATTVGAILNRRYLDKGFDGNSTAEAYGVICDSTINTQTMKNQGLVACRIGIRNKQTAEFIWFNITQYSSGGSITE